MYLWEGRLLTAWQRVSSTREQRLRGENEIDVYVIDQPSMVHEVKRLNEVENINTMVLFVAQDKVALFASLIPHIDKFNDVLEYKASLFLVLPKVIQLLVPVMCQNSYPSTLQNFFFDRSSKLKEEFSPTRRKWCWKRK